MASHVDPGTEQLPDYHELTSTRHAERLRDQQYRKDTRELNTPATKPYLILIFLCYAAIALTSWAILCLLGRGPVFGKDWPDGMRQFRAPANGLGYFKAASVLSSVAAALTIPTTATICAYAAVPFAQYHAKGQKLTLRQTLALADQRWMSPLLIPTLIIPTQNRKHGSHFLWFASFLTVLVLGLVVWPIQQGFVEPLTITKAASRYQPSMYSIRAFDIPQLFTGNTFYDNEDVLRLREVMKSWSNRDCNSHVWWNGTKEDLANWQTYCARSQTSDGATDFAGVSTDLSVYDEEDSREVQYFMAQMPYGFNTGFERAFVPRFNTTVQYQNITESSAPEGCFDQQQEANLIKYQYDYEDDDGMHYNWSIKACISSSALKTPMQNTRDRQDFNEEFYLSITEEREGNSGAFKVSASTTIGYYELPNYHNNGTQGPLLQTYTISDEDDISTYYYLSNSIDDDEAPTALETVQNKGSLTTIFSALFGNGSFPAAWTNPGYAAWLAATTNTSDESNHACADHYPLTAMMARGRTYHTDECIRPGYANTGGIQDHVAAWLARWFDADLVRPALETSAFLANEIRLLHSVDAGGIYVRSDPGVDVVAPVVSSAGLVVGSVLLGAWLLLLLLLLLLLFAVCTPHWTDRLDADAVLKMGAAMALSTEGLARLGGGRDVLDRAPGFVGDAMAESEVGRLAVGAEGVVRRGRRYETSICGMMQG